jgi:uncharacterized protein (TIGR02596 family)
MRSPQQDRSGFSLIELLAVLAVIGILGVLIAPSLNSIIESSNLTRTAELASDQINLARQLASSRSTTVEVRFIRLPTRQEAGYHALQLWSTDSTGNSIAISRLASLPPSTVISAQTTSLSPIFLILGNPATMPTGGATSEAPYVSFRIRAGGIVAPVITSANKTEFYFSIVSSKNAASTEPPNNFISIQINPNTATTAIYRPN